MFNSNRMHDYVALALLGVCALGKHGSDTLAEDRVLYGLVERPSDRLHAATKAFGQGSPIVTDTVGGKPIPPAEHVSATRPVHTVWEQRVDSGRVYYVNPDNETIYRYSRLPPWIQWTSTVDPSSGRKFYIDNHSKTTHWELPSPKITDETSDPKRAVPASDGPIGARAPEPAVQSPQFKARKAFIFDEFQLDDVVFNEDKAIYKTDAKGARTKVGELTIRQGDNYFFELINGKKGYFVTEPMAN